MRHVSSHMLGCLLVPTATVHGTGWGWGETTRIGVMGSLRLDGKAELSSYAELRNTWCPVILK